MKRISNGKQMHISYSITNRRRKLYRSCVVV